jgi:hypothetical protein
MRHIVLAASFLSLVPIQQMAAKDPPVRVTLSDVRLAQGDRERVRVKTSQDGYVVVLRMDEAGQVRFLYPVDPVDNNAVKGGKEFEVRSHGDREAFVVGGRPGAGLVLAARADTPFNFSPFMTGGHWNTDALVPTAGKDAEAALVNVLDRMTGAHYDYDALAYTVGLAAPPGVYAGPYFVPYGSYYDPWFYDPFYGPAFGIRSTVVVPIGPRFGFRRQ